MKIKAYQILEALFSALEQASSRAREHFAICPNCGANRYTGKACVNNLAQGEQVPCQQK